MISIVEISIFVILSAWIDAEHLKDNDYIESHLSRWLLRFLFCLVASDYDPIKFIGLGLFFAATFDNTLNLFRGKKIFSIGDTALWDIFWQRNKVLYIVLIILSLIFSLWILSHK